MSVENKTQEQSKNELTPEQRNEAIYKYIEQADDAGVLAINSLEVKKVTPKAYDLCMDFMSTKAGGMNFDEETIIGTFMYAPRNVFYEFFDENKIYINIMGENQAWKFTFDITISKEYPTRISAEKTAFMEAFKLLESTIK